MEQLIQELISTAEKGLKEIGTTPRPVLTIDQDEMENLLRMAYEASVRSRRCTMSGNAHLDDMICNVARWLTDPDLKPGLLLCGSVGNGKTTMARAVYAVIKKLVETAQHMNMDQSVTGYRSFIPTNELTPIFKYPIPEMVTAQRIADMAGDREGLASYAKKGFLIVDDLGCEPIAVKNYGTEITPLTTLIYYRYDHLLPTMITTNFDFGDIETVYGPRVLDRIKEMCNCIGINTKSYRR